MGDRLVVDVGPVAHGGHCVARHEGQVLFVRHTLPGERVEVVVTDVGPKARYLRADAIEVLSASGDRVAPPCPFSGPGACGGCDWQHVDLAAQRRLKADVVREQLRRLADLDLDVTVEPVPGEVDGLGWRTRVRYAVDAQGAVGLRRHRSHDVQPVAACALAHPLVAAVDPRQFVREGVTEVEVRAGAVTGDVRVLANGVPEGPEGSATHEVAAGRRWQVTADGFWQVHPGAADLLVDAVVTALRPRLGDHVIDLYSGVGLFAGAFADLLGPGGRVDAVETATRAADDAAANLGDLATVHLHHARVDRFLARTSLRRCDLVVLDPPRSGAGAEVVAKVVRLRPRGIGYVACDPASLARDVATLAAAGYRLSGLRAFDLFPMTHHVECLAWFQPDSDDILISR